MFVYVNGKIIPYEKACISVLDRGLHYGDGAFESLRTFNGKPFMLKEHLERLRRSVSAIKIPITKMQDTNKLQYAINKLIKLNKFKESYIKIIVTRGEMKRTGISMRNINGGPTVIILVLPQEIWPKKEYEKGWKAIVSSIIRPDSIRTHIKSLNYLDCLLAKMEAEKAGAHEAFLTDVNGNILEGASSNVFIVKRGIIFTAPLSAPILAGTMRSWALKKIKQMKLKYKEKFFDSKELLSADECFITNSAVGVMPIVKIDGHKIGNDKMRKITQILLTTFTNGLTLHEQGYILYRG